MGKHVLGHMRAAKAQISLYYHAVWSGPSLSANRIIGYYSMHLWRAKTWYFVHAQDDLNLNFELTFWSQFVESSSSANICWLASNWDLISSSICFLILSISAIKYTSNQKAATELHAMLKVKKKR